MELKLVQTEKTYEFKDIDGNGYTATLISNAGELYFQWDIFDDDGNEVEAEEFKMKLIEQIESLL